jgi:hypothetical protein
MSYAFTRDVPVDEHHYAEVRIAQARAWQWWAELRGDLCEHRSATAAVQRACDELTQVSTIAPATGHVTVAEENRP